MPQLSPLPWVFSFIMILMLIVSMLVIYFMNFMKLNELSDFSVKLMKWCW
uniref:ATP synthase F0 subunit 8 n=1 Tax=Austrarchaea sp. SA_1 TaxID=1090238 RepID=H2E4G1_9ARAC|nr:ATP synthase F0 subunit 8 [Austrarchaea sp. SA_1]AEX89073.1 ATP synthase F0 subunit 8 [Austrarchaea sp. SA_1]AEX89076.1 ATP synthase F0 subunit 8 [Austrarchaea sp. SA_1]